MNSKQLNFYFHPIEINDILKFLESLNSNISIEPLKSNKINLIETSIFFPKQEVIHRIVLFNKDQNKEDIKLKYIDTQDYYLFDYLESNIIQFDIPFIILGNELIKSRFYFKTGFWNGDIFVTKDSNFIEWSNGVFKAFKKKFLTAKVPITKELCTDYVKNLIDRKDLVLKQL